MSVPAHGFQADASCASLHAWQMPSQFLVHSESESPTVEGMHLQLLYVEQAYIPSSPSRPVLQVTYPWRLLADAFFAW